MAVRGVLACHTNLRSRDKLKKPAQSQVTPKKSAVNSDATEKRSKLPRSRNTVTKANGSTQRQLRSRKVVDKNQNTIEEAFKRSKNANQQQRQSKEQKSTTESQKTGETNKKLPIYKTISPEKCLKDQDSVYEFIFDPNDTQEKMRKKKRLNAKKQKKGSSKTQNNIKKNKKKRLDTHIAKDKILPVPTLAKQTEELNIKSVKTKNTKRKEKKQIDFRTAEDKISPVTELAKSTEDLNAENAETENTKKEKKQIDIRTAENKILPVTELAKQTQELNVEDVETENIKKDKQREVKISFAEEKTSFLTTLAEKNEELNISTPKIISIENVDDMIVNRISNIENFRSPLRPRNLVDNTIVKQQRSDDSKYVSLTKSLSPISNTGDLININSPWRPPTLSMFSRAKHFIQSTPKVMQFVPKVQSKLNKKSFVEGKENKQAIKKKELVKKNKAAIDSKTFAMQENRENEFLETDKEDRQVTNGEIVEERRKDERLVKDKEDSEIPAKQEKHLVDYLNFSDTFDVLSESERRSVFGTEIRLFEDVEPTHFSEPPKRIYKRKRGVRVHFSEESDTEENKENAREKKPETKKKRKYTKAEKENEKRISEWILTVNSTFEEIDNYDLLVE